MPHKQFTVEISANQQVYLAYETQDARTEEEAKQEALEYAKAVGLTGFSTSDDLLDIQVDSVTVVEVPKQTHFRIRKKQQ